MKRTTKEHIKRYLEDLIEDYDVFVTETKLVVLLKTAAMIVGGWVIASSLIGLFL